MKQEWLIHHTAADGYVSYGRNGSAGNDILIAPSGTLEENRLFIRNVDAPDTTVASLLDNGPDEAMQAALNTLMPVWNTAIRGNVYVAHNGIKAHSLCDGFMDSVRRNYARERLCFDTAQEDAMDVIAADIRESSKLFEEVADPDNEHKLRLFYYPPASLPVSVFHNWHADVFPATILGQMRLQRSISLQGLSFAFKEQGNPAIKAGVSLSTGHSVFKITPENVHKGAPVSPTQGRLIYTITAEPKHNFF